MCIYFKRSCDEIVYLVVDKVRKKNTFGVLANLTLVSQIGISMVLPILGGVWAGHWLDERLGTKILFLIVFVFLGIGASFYNLYNLTSKGINKRK